MEWRTFSQVERQQEPHSEVCWMHMNGRERKYEWSSQLRPLVKLVVAHL